MGRVHHHGKVALPLHRQHRRQVQGVAGVRLEGADAPLAQDHVGVPPRHDVFRAHQPLLDGGGQPPLQQDGLVGPAHLFQQVEVLHIPRPDLDHVHRLLKQGELIRAHQLGHDGQAGGLPGLVQQEDALHPLALEGVRGGTGLVGPAPQGRRPGLPDGPGHLQNLPLALHGAGPGDNRQLLPADGHAAADVNHGVVWVVLAVGLLIGLRNAHDPLHAGELGQGLLVQPARVALRA